MCCFKGCKIIVHVIYSKKLKELCEYEDGKCLKYWMLIFKKWPDFIDL